MRHCAEFLVVSMTISAVVATIFAGQRLACHGPQWLWIAQGDNHAFDVGWLAVATVAIAAELVTGKIVFKKIAEGHEG